MAWTDEMIKVSLGIFLRKVNLDYERFLNEMSARWGREVESFVSVKSEGADESLNDLFRDVLMFNETYCRRDIQFSRDSADFRDQEDRINALEESIKRGGRLTPHPTVLALRGQLLMLGWCWEEAARVIGQAVESNIGDGDEPIVGKRDAAIQLGWLARCIYQLGHFDKAIGHADKSYEIAKSLAQDGEEESFQRLASDNHHFCSALTSAYFACCDTRVHHGEWDDREELRAQFRRWWNDSERNCNAPFSWLPPLKIEVFSDHLWAVRLEPYATDIARSLYEESGPPSLRAFRKLRCMVGFNVDYSRLPRAACILLMLAFMASYATNASGSMHSAADVLNQPVIMNKVLTSLEALPEGQSPDGFVETVKFGIPLELQRLPLSEALQTIKFDFGTSPNGWQHYPLYVGGAGQLRGDLLRPGNKTVGGVQNFTSAAALIDAGRR